MAHIRIVGLHPVHEAKGGHARPSVEKGLAKRRRIGRDTRLVQANVPQRIGRISLCHLHGDRSPLTTEVGDHVPPRPVLLQACSERVS